MGRQCNKAAGSSRSAVLILRYLVPHLLNMLCTKGVKYIANPNEVQPHSLSEPVSSNADPCPTDRAARPVRSSLGWGPLYPTPLHRGLPARLRLLLTQRFTASRERLKFDCGKINTASGEFWLRTLWDNGFAAAENVGNFAEEWATSVCARMGHGW